MAEMERFDPRCGAGYLGLQSAPGALLRALGFESLKRHIIKDTLCQWQRVSLMAEMERFELSKSF